MKIIVLAFSYSFYIFSQHPGKSDAASSEAPVYEILCIYFESFNICYLKNEYGINNLSSKLFDLCTLI